MTSIADGSVKIQTTSESNPSPPSWCGEVVLLIGYLRKHGVLSKIPAASSPTTPDVILSRAQRAHTRLSWETRLARNARSTGSGHHQTVRYPRRDG